MLYAEDHALRSLGNEPQETPGTDERARTKGSGMDSMRNLQGGTSEAG
ncbi:hypothetical protein DB31_6530 [Hyalangium minutum]|uniref:Uncharacterized protein n=1 Tax=Hyalangium minutum TaxID=394096 RepID=A0A085WPE2_9BACT|nr:hypothetical protein DB31_6530 [Hyalangium minutum]